MPEPQAGLCVLQGYAALDRMKSSSSKEERATWLEMAMGPLFRAASALGSEASPRAASSACMRAVLQWLLKSATAAAFEDLGPHVSSFSMPGL